MVWLHFSAGISNKGMLTTKTIKKLVMEIKKTKKITTESTEKLITVKKEKNTETTEKNKNLCVLCG